MTARILSFIKTHWLLLLALAITIGAIFVNIFGYPTMEGDEGVYVGQAWWLVNFGKIAPYVYWYDHFPLGWLFIGLWQKLTGGPFAFGLAVFSGRVFIGLLVIATNLFLYKIIQTITKSPKLAFLGSLYFALSPLALFFHRRVLLDNIATFWLMASVYLLVSARGRLVRYFLSALFFGLAFLSKEVVIFALPVYLLAIITTSSRLNRAFTILIAVLTVSYLVFQFPLLAMLRGEFLPSGWLGSGEHVSFLNTATYQAARGAGLPFWKSGSDFLMNLGAWWKSDFFLIGIGLWSFVVNLVWSNRWGRIVSLFGASFLLFLVRGGLVFNFYVLPLLPFLIISLVLMLDLVLNHGPFLRPVGRWLFYPAAIFILIFLVWVGQYFFTEDITKNQRTVISDIKTSLPSNSVIISDFTPWVDLRLSRFDGDPEFPHVDWFYKAEDEREIREGRLKSNYKNIDYLVMTNEFLNLVKAGSMPFLKQALENSVLIKDYPPLVPNAGRDLSTWTSKENSWVAVFQIKKPLVSFAPPTPITP